jgi:hypothetical protein
MHAVMRLWRTATLAIITAICFASTFVARSVERACHYSVWNKTAKLAFPEVRSRLCVGKST